MFNLETWCWIFLFFFLFSLGRSVVSCTPFASCGHLHAVMFTVAKVFCTAMFIKIPPFLAWRQHGESALRRRRGSRWMFAVVLFIHVFSFPFLLFLASRLQSKYQRVPAEEALQAVDSSGSRDAALVICVCSLGVLYRWPFSGGRTGSLVN